MTSKDKKPFSWDDAYNEVAERNAAAFDAANTPEATAARAEKAKAEFKRGVELGWWDEEGNPLETGEEE